MTSILGQWEYSVWQDDEQHEDGDRTTHEAQANEQLPQRIGGASSPSPGARLLALTSIGASGAQTQQHGRFKNSKGP